MTVPAATLPAHSEQIAPSHRRSVERVIEAMCNRLDEHLSLDDLAAVAHLSPFYFHRVFRHATGLPPGRFLSALRIEAAKRLLLSSELSVTEVCFEVGYHSPGTFTSQFSRLVGLSPRRLRNLSRGKSGPGTALFAQHNGSADCVPAVTGRLSVDDGFSGIAFVGLFPTRLPEGDTGGCTVAPVPGAYRISTKSEGPFYVLGFALPTTAEWMSAILPERDAHVGRSARAVLVRPGQTVSGVDLLLRPRRLTDPPILVAPGVLFGSESWNTPERVATTAT
jgi:AraC family transcriptional regulator